MKRPMNKVARDLMGRKNTTFDPRPNRQRTRADIERHEIALDEDREPTICFCYCHADPDHCGSCTNDYADLCERPSE